MLSNPVRSAVVGTLLTAGLVGGISGTAAATEAHPSARADDRKATAEEPLACATVDVLQSALEDLSTTTDPQLLNVALAQVVALLQQQPPLVSPELVPTYHWLVTKLQVLRGLVATLPSPALIGLVNGLAANLADALDSVPCALVTDDD